MGPGRFAFENHLAALRGHGPENEDEKQRVPDHSTMLRRDDRLRELRDQRADYHEEKNSNKPASFGNGEPGPDHRAENVADRHRRGVLINNVSAPAEVNDRGDV